MSSIKGIIFDYGGTIDTNGVHWGEFIREQYIKAGVEIDKELFREAYVHGERSLAKSPIIAPSDTFRTLLIKKMALQFDYLRSKAASTSFTKEKEEEVALLCYNNVRKTLEQTRTIVERLHREYPLVLVTNFYGNMPVVLKEFGLEGLFKEIVESSVVGLRKPDPALFALGVKALNLPAEEILVVGDSYRKDIYPSSTLGCKTAWIKKVCWEEEPILPGHEPTVVIDTLTTLPEAIERI